MMWRCKYDHRVWSLGVELPDPWPDMSNIAWDRRLLTSMVMLTSLSSFSGVVLRGLDMMIVEHPPRGNAFQSGSFTMGCGMSISRYTDLPPVRLMPLARDSGREIMMGSLHPFNPTSRWPASLRWGAGRLSVGWFFCRQSYQPLLEAGCLGAPPQRVVHGRCPHLTTPGHRANQVHWRHRQSVP